MKPTTAVDPRLLAAYTAGVERARTEYRRDPSAAAHEGRLPGARIPGADVRVATVRRWAREQGLSVSVNGALSARVVAAWLEAHGGAA